MDYHCVFCSRLLLWVGNLISNSCLQFWARFTTRYMNFLCFMQIRISFVLCKPDTWISFVSCKSQHARFWNDSEHHFLVPNHFNTPLGRVFICILCLYLFLKWMSSSFRITHPFQDNGAKLNFSLVFRLLFCKFLIFWLFFFMLLILYLYLYFEMKVSIISWYRGFNTPPQSFSKLAIVPRRIFPSH